MGKNRRIGQIYLYACLASFSFALAIGLFLKISQLLGLSSDPYFRGLYLQGLSLHGLTMMLLFSLPLYHGGFAHFLWASQWRGDSVAEGARAKWVRWSSFAVNLHLVGAVALVIGAMSSHLMGGWMIELPELIGPHALGGALLVSGIFMVNLARCADSINFIFSWIRLKRAEPVEMSSAFMVAVLSVSAAYAVLLLTLAGAASMRLLGKPILWTEVFAALVRPSVYLLAPCGLGLLIDLWRRQDGPEEFCLRAKDLKMIHYSLVSMGAMGAVRFAFRALVVFRPSLGGGALAEVVAFATQVEHWSSVLMGLMALPLLVWLGVVLRGLLRRWQKFRFDLLFIYVAMTGFLVLIGVGTGLFILAEPMLPFGGVPGVAVVLSARTGYFLVAHFHVILMATNLLPVMCFVALRGLSRNGSPRFWQRPEVVSPLGLAVAFLTLFAMGAAGVVRHQTQLGGPAWVLGWVSLLGALGFFAASATMLWRIWRQK